MADCERLNCVPEIFVFRRAEALWNINSALSKELGELVARGGCTSGVA
jgi:hypothetical protein